MRDAVTQASDSNCKRFLSRVREGDTGGTRVKLLGAEWHSFMAKILYTYYYPLPPSQLKNNQLIKKKKQRTRWG
jgi:hypothetical protein